jgi:hypothetical protein
MSRNIRFYLEREKQMPSHDLHGYGVGIAWDLAYDRKRFGRRHHD